MVNKLDELKFDYICSQCALRYDGEWPPHHVATTHISMCPYCGETKALSNIGDWDWPDGVARGMRD